MKRLFIAVLISLLAVSGANAGGRKVAAKSTGSGIIRQNCGCGLGSRWMRNSKSAMAHWLALYLNGITGQVYGVTSGTQDCKEAPTFAFNERLETFVADNMDNLAKDIAMGQGETVDTLAELMEVPVQDWNNFSLTLQAHFSDIFSSPEVSNTDVVENIMAVWYNG